MMRRGQPDAQLYVPFIGKQRKINSSPLKRQMALPVNAQAPIPISPSNRHAPNQFEAAISSRESAMRPNRFKRNARLKSGRASHVINANATYAIKIGQMNGANSG